MGVRQVFVRFAGCNLSCWYCDTPASRVDRPETCAIQTPPEGSVCRNVPNPLEVGAVKSFVVDLESSARGHHSVSLTGGEPLEQVDFLKELCPELRKAGLRIYLETNGTLPAALKFVLPDVDIVAMDCKLQSATGAKPDLEIHRAFLEVAAGAEVFVKAVVARSTNEREIEDCASVIATVGKAIPLVIQPVTPVVDHIDAPRGFQLMQFHAAARKYLDDVRVIPQCQRMLGLR